MIKAVIFDLGGVVLKGKSETFLMKGEKILGKKALEANELCFDKKLLLGTCSLRAALERIFEKKMSDEEFIPLAKAWFANWKPDEQIIEFAKSLKKRHRTAILSNSEKSYEEKYDEMLRKVFSPIVYSHRERMLKPNPKIFELCLKKLGLKAEECVMVDDCKENQKPCRQLGIHFIQFKGLEKLRKDLELYGVRA